MTDTAQQLSRLQHFIQFEIQVRQAQTKAELGFVVCNASKTLLNFKQAIFWLAQGSAPNIQTISGAANLDTNSPFIGWLKGFIRYQYRKEQANTVFIAQAEHLPDSLRQQWSTWLPPQVVCCQLSHQGQKFGGILFCSDRVFSDKDINLIHLIGQVVSYSLSAILNKRHPSWVRTFTRRRRVIASAVVVILVVTLLLPVHLTVLAPAEITADNPDMVTSPLNGVVKKFFIKPNQAVKQGELLLELDPTDLMNRLEVAKQNYQAALEQLRKANQHAFRHPKSSADLALLKIELNKSRQEVNYNKTLLLRSKIHAPHNGIAVFADEDNWLGKPVKIGEKIMAIADPQYKKLTIWLPSADSIKLSVGAKVKYYLNAEPFHVLKAKLVYHSYSATLQANHDYSYHLTAQFSPDQRIPRIGLRGTAKVYGKRVTLIYYLMRRPIALIRQWLGW